tara:strand:- start:940 stop:1671 length:732 start_codon:yes stop_codon:yes gene_type:complete
MDKQIVTEELFRENGYLTHCEATILNIVENKIVLDRTVFYPEGGGQPGDIGVLICADGSEITIEDTYKGKNIADPAHYHVAAIGIELPHIGDPVTLKLDWVRRYKIMRMHSCMHMLCAVIPAPVSGGSISENRGRLDFDLPDPINRDKITQQLQALIKMDRPMSLSWITDEELDKRKDLVRTMSVKPPTGTGRVRLVSFEGIDLQPCGGTHVASSAEIGDVYVRKIEKKGKRNRRVTVEFVDR